MLIIPLNTARLPTTRHIPRTMPDAADDKLLYHNRGNVIYNIIISCVLAMYMMYEHRMYIRCTSIACTYDVYMG